VGNFSKLIGLLLMLNLLFIVLYCEKKHGRGKELADYSSQSLLPPPGWARGGVLYQVFPRVFSQAGTFQGIIDRLDYIENLGVNIVWFMPIFPIGEKGRKGSLGCPYSVRDFRAINPEYGTVDDFHWLVQEIHRRGMKVIIGIVPNHSSNDNILMKDHPDWFFRDKKGHFSREVADWSDVTDFNYDQPTMREYMLETLLYWVREFDIDGYRCDVAGMVPYDFWQEALQKLRQLKPDIFLLAEWEDPEIVLTGFTSDYDWTLYRLLLDIRKKKNRSAEAVTFIQERDRLYPQNSLPMRFLENHDEPRSLAQVGPAAIEAYATFLFTLPGIPLIYAGQEIGETQKPSLFEKSTLNWADPDTSLFSLYQSLISLRRENSCFTSGNFVQLPTANLSGSVGAFLRFGSESAAIVIANLKNKPARQILIHIPPEVKGLVKKYQWEGFKTAAPLFKEGLIYLAEVEAFRTVIYLGKNNNLGK
jgi:cyclomaltodextrinase